MLTDDSGFVMGTAIMVSAILILAGVFAIWTASTEVQLVRNESELIREFYNAEAGVVDALENYKTGTTQWLTNNFLLDGPAKAGTIVYSVDPNGQRVCDIEVRCIREDYSDDDTELIENLSLQARTLPRQRHVGPPPTGSGFSLKYFEVRRYGITATSSEGNTQLQVGAWKVFNKY